MFKLVSMAGSTSSMCVLGVIAMYVLSQDFFSILATLFCL